MNNILTHVVTEGTGRAAQIPGIIAAGKTGTTNNSTNAWFNGFTGNLVCSVWFGNDDNSPTAGMTGGTLPAMTWHDIMLYAHQGLEIKPPYGVAPGPPKAPEIAAAGQAGNGEAKAPRPIGLSPRAAQVITEIGDLARVDKGRSAERTQPVSFAAQTAPDAGVSGSLRRRAAVRRCRRCAPTASSWSRQSAISHLSALAPASSRTRCSSRPNSPASPS